ncbi:inositol monophosphatase family protein [Sulfurospirillum barnesii]|uniref:Inositol monophosphatase/fructose-1,6-bisphosphatase family protein n=1 Tax=Sulfurospirillum barnesii (strain ATCC 700032 / DSM 10660 / SES-3) TaxID=760154 RepID=I3XVC2_SULBS|nr:inositol monophosphatase family protein [Sulfurospirillum barnesii]AFL67896.1 inositol monophosphatase/fructose-1,6-bisphosphatase family protein [Sulfurospirillum barnesii SES-3]
MNFIEASLCANEELYTLLHVKGLVQEHHLAFDVGAGGDVSVGIDLVAEKIFIKYLLPFGEIHSEESGVIKSPTASARIVLDPIDGSENLLSHLPYYGTSVAYFEAGKCTQAVIANLANGDVFIKDEKGLRRGKIGSKNFLHVEKNSFSKVGIFERSYASLQMHEKLHNAQIKYRSPGAFALSLAYAHEVAFVLYVGKMRSYDVEAGLFMCERLYTFHQGDIFLVSKDKETLDKIIGLFKSD